MYRTKGKTIIANTNQNLKVNKINKYEIKVINCFIIFVTQKNNLIA